MSEIIKDMHPRDVIYTSLYESKPWTAFTGTQHTRDRIHVARANDMGDWTQIDAGACAMNICDPSSRQIGWGSTRTTFNKFQRRYKTRILCLDQLRHVEEAAQQMEGIWQGLALVPEDVNGNFIRYQQASGADYLHICGSAGYKVSGATFTGGLNVITLGSASYVPASKLTMPFLQSKIAPLQYNGYFDGEFTPTGKFQLITDMQSQYELSNGNPALSGMFDAADFEKGGKFYQYGAMGGCGNFLFKTDPFPARFYHMGGGVLKRVMPYENVAATVGIKPQVSAAYENAPIQLSVIPHRKARTQYTGEIAQINPNMKFGTRDLYGKWNWINDDYLVAYDPNTGAECEMDNPVKNKGYFLADFEMSLESVRPELECVILHLRETQAVADVPRAASVTYPTTDGSAYQSLLPYNSAFCDPDDEE